MEPRPYFRSVHRKILLHKAWRNALRIQCTGPSHKQNLSINEPILYTCIWI